MPPKVPWSEEEKRQVWDYIYACVKNNSITFEAPTGLKFWDSFIKKTGTIRQKFALNKYYRTKLRDDIVNSHLNTSQIDEVLKKLPIDLSPMSRQRLQIRRYAENRGSSAESETVVVKQEVHSPGRRSTRLIHSEKVNYKDSLRFKRQDSVPVAAKKIVTPSASSSNSSIATRSRSRQNNENVSNDSIDGFEPSELSRLLDSQNFLNDRSMLSSVSSTPSSSSVSSRKRRGVFSSGKSPLNAKRLNREYTPVLDGTPKSRRSQSGKTPAIDPINLPENNALNFPENNSVVAPAKEVVVVPENNVIVVSDDATDAAESESFESLPSSADSLVSVIVEQPIPSSSTGDKTPNGTGDKTSNGTVDKTPNGTGDKTPNGITNNEEFIAPTSSAKKTKNSPVVPSPMITPLSVSSSEAQLTPSRKSILSSGSRKQNQNSSLRVRFGALPAAEKPTNATPTSRRSTELSSSLVDEKYAQLNFNCMETVWNAIQKSRPENTRRSITQEDFDSFKNLGLVKECFSKLRQVSKFLENMYPAKVQEKPTESANEPTTSVEILPENGNTVEPTDNEASDSIEVELLMQSSQW